MLNDRCTVLVQLLIVYGDEQWVALSLVVSSLASLISSTAGAFSTSITVDHVYGFVARFFQTLKTEVIHWIGSLGVEAMKHSSSLAVSPNWMLICFHFADTLLATSFIRSNSSGSLSSPLYLLAKSVNKKQSQLTTLVHQDIVPAALSCDLTWSFI